jgi:hypothetical protein
MDQGRRYVAYTSIVQLQNQQKAQQIQSGVLGIFIKVWLD